MSGSKINEKISQFLGVRRNRIREDKLWFHDDLPDCRKTGANRKCCPVDNSQSGYSADGKIPSVDGGGKKRLFAHIPHVRMALN